MWVIAYIAFMVAVGIMADKRNRNVFGWVILSLIASPLAAGILLLVLGENRDSKN